MYQHQLYVSYQPGPPLDRFVEQLWYWDGIAGPHAKDRLLPSGAASLIINLEEDEVRDYRGEHDDIMERFPGAVLVGAFSRYSVIDTREQRRVLGISFRPGGTWPFFDPAAEEAHNSHIAIQDLWGSAGGSLRERVLAAPTPYAKLRLLETELRRRAVRPLQRRAELDFALRCLTHEPQEHTIATLSERVGLSTRRFARLFTLEVGMTPKLYARIKRFEHVMRRMHVPGLDWGELAQSCGYFDQSHLIRDCRLLSGFTPRELAARHTGQHNHIPLL
jgi:AraC-like DNA-binding protein